MKGNQVFEEFRRAHTKVFFSLDLAGSTAFKQRSDEELSDEDGPGHLKSWARHTHHFYALANRLLAEQLRDGPTRLSPKVARPFRNDLHRLWKGAGDELIFERIVEGAADLPVIAMACLATYHQIRKAVRERSQGKLDVKAAIWSAGFPDVNLFLPIDDVMQDDRLADMFDQDEAVYRRDLLIRAVASVIRGDRRWDYVGPGMDTGFRVASMAKAGDVVMSVDFTFLLTCALVNLANQPGGSKGLEALALEIGDGKPLKGVWRNKVYPRIRIDCETPAQRRGHDSLIRHWTEIRDRLMAFYQELQREGLPLTIALPPYLMGNNKVEIGEVPTESAALVEVVMGHAPADQLATPRARRGSSAPRVQQAPLAASGKDPKEAIHAPLSGFRPLAKVQRARVLDLEEIQAIRRQVRWMRDSTMRYMEEKVVQMKPRLEPGQKTQEQHAREEAHAYWVRELSHFLDQTRRGVRRSA